MQSDRGISCGFFFFFGLLMIRGENWGLQRLKLHTQGYTNAKGQRKDLNPGLALSLQSHDFWPLTLAQQPQSYSSWNTLCWVSSPCLPPSPPPSQACNSGTPQAQPFLHQLKPTVCMSDCPAREELPEGPGSAAPQHPPPPPKVYIPSTGPGTQKVHQTTSRDGMRSSWCSGVFVAWCFRMWVGPEWGRIVFVVCVGFRICWLVLKCWKTQAIWSPSSGAESYWVPGFSLRSLLLFSPALFSSSRPGVFIS